MPVTFNVDLVGKQRLWNKSAFDGRAIFLVNPYVMLTGEEFKSIQTFHAKREAMAFCSRWSLPPNALTLVESRFQRGWAIGLGRRYFVPQHAEGLLFAHAMGGVVTSICDESLWLCSGSELD